MIQTILVIVSIAAALYYLGKKAYALYFKKEHKCMGCAVYKIKKG